MPTGMGAAAYGLRRLVQMCGGDTAVKGQYDVWNQITVSSSKVTNLGDARTKGGSTYGPALTASGALEPAYNNTATTLPSIGGSTSTYMQTAASSLFNGAAALTLVYFGASTATANLVLMTVSDEPNEDTYINIMTLSSSGTKISSEALQNQQTEISTVAGSTTMRCVVVSVTAPATGAQTLSLTVPNGTAVAGTGTANISSSPQLWLGADGSGATPSGAKYVGAMIIAAVLTAQMVQEIARFGGARYGCVHA